VEWYCLFKYVTEFFYGVDDKQKCDVPLFKMYRTTSLSFDVERVPLKKKAPHSNNPQKKENKDERPIDQHHQAQDRRDHHHQSHQVIRIQKCQELDPPSSRSDHYHSRPALVSVSRT
jgi:hypothetical protein